MKTVLNSKDVARVFLKQTQLNATNTSRSFFFNRDKIYSYGTHFCVAKLTGDRILLSNNSYSPTTTKHISLVKQEITSERIIYCSYPNGTHSDNFKHWKEEVKNLNKKLERAKKPELYLGKKLDILVNVKNYADFFNTKIPLYLLRVLDATEAESVINDNKKIKDGKILLSALISWGLTED